MGTTIDSVVEPQVHAPRGQSCPYGRHRSWWDSSVPARAGGGASGTYLLSASPMNRSQLSTFALPSHFPTFWQTESSLHPRFSFSLEPLAVPLLDPRQWRLWCEHFVDLSVCLVGVRLTWTRDEEHRAWIEYLELLIIQAWRTDVEGNLLGFLFRSVRPDHRQLIVQELSVPLAQLVDDLLLEIVSQSNESPVPHVLTRTLKPYLEWSVCLEEPGSGRNPPSQRGYLDPHEIIDLAFFQDRTVSEDEELAIEEEEEEEEAVEEDDKEETPEEGSYSEDCEGEKSDEEEEEEQGEEEEELELEESEWEISAEEAEQTDAQVEDPEAARKREKIAVGKRQLEFASGANLQIADDPARDPESPKAEDGHPPAETLSAPARWRRSRSPSPSTSDRPSVRARTDAGHRASSPVVISPSP
ncbi:hypothetical protein CBR_g55051 [Chara braunii]|uniref:Uncharacterized protein n=1 Tax=Chara braunii TaxID=69332 RepID=A0A388MCT0_CHABU|nr:hypothetical protein CBR_g55051 [Chara braunii]|eukprot:GBG92282.1 hypothetical protein CBR_g55051 [Chara braunii]